MTLKMYKEEKMQNHPMSKPREPLVLGSLSTSKGVEKPYRPQQGQIRLVAGAMCDCTEPPGNWTRSDDVNTIYLITSFHHVFDQILQFLRLNYLKLLGSRGSKIFEVSSSEVRTKRLLV